MSPVFTQDRPQESSLLVYFNGVETPAQGVQVQMNVGEIPNATISVAPSRELIELGAEDRVQVAAFYLDNYYTEMTGVRPDFRLLFEGDIVGWQYQNTGSGRSLQFTAINFLKILDELYMAFIQGLDSMVTGVLATQKNPAQWLSAAFGPTFPVTLLYSGLDTAAQKLIRRPYDMIENAIRACTGRLEQNKLGSVAATNFFARYIRNTGLIDRFVPSPLLEIDHMRLSEDVDPEGVFPLLRYVRQQDTLELFKKHMNQMANKSVLTIVNDIFSRMYYEISAITTAPIAQVNITGSGVRGDIVGPAVFSESAKAEDQKAAITQALLQGRIGDALSAASGAVDASQPNRILNYVTKPQWLFGVPPACNIIFPSMYESVTYQENYDAQPTRLYMNNNWLVNLLQKQGGMGEFTVPSAGYPQQVQVELNKRAGLFQQGNETISGKNFLVWPEEYFKGPRVREEDLPDWFMMLFQNANQKTNYDVKNPPYEQDEILDLLGWGVSRLDGTLLEGQTDPIEQSFYLLPADRAPTEQELLNAKKQKLSWLQQIYARYEYYRQRASHRSGAVQMMFNPYIVPGFPAVIFDSLDTGNHVVGYVTSVVHNVSAQHAQTSVSFTLSQTLDTYLHEILEARTGDNPELRQYTISAAPANPIPEVRAVTQVLDKAEEYFTTLFHQRQTYKGGPVKRAAFDIYSAVRLVLESGEVVGIDNQRDLLFKDYLDRYVKMIPTTPYAPMFDHAMAAMRFVSRPVCTLEEYISFQEKGIRKGKIYPSNRRQGKGGIFYEEILDLVQGPGDLPVIDENNNLKYPITVDTRANWRQRLINYRTKVLFHDHPQED